MNTVETDREVLTVAEAAIVAKVGRTTLYQAFSSGALKARKVGRRTIILRTDLQDWLNGLPVLRPGVSLAADLSNAA